jgi:hypothetical protein
LLSELPCQFSPKSYRSDRTTLLPPALSEAPILPMFAV